MFLLAQNSQAALQSARGGAEARGLVGIATRRRPLDLALQRVLEGDLSDTLRDRGRDRGAATDAAATRDAEAATHPLTRRSASRTPLPGMMVFATNL